MKVLLTFLALVAVSYTGTVDVAHSAYGYLEKHGVPLAEKIRKAEEAQSRIVGGVPAVEGQYPWQAGLIIDLVDLEIMSVCGASLISNCRLVTAAHCWFDGVHQGWRFTVVLGTARLFSGGTRIQTSAIAVHPKWVPLLVRNDVAVIYLPTPVTFSDVIAPISLPTAAEVNKDFSGQSAIASGFGITANGSGIIVDQSLSHVRLNVITNSVCSWAFPFILQSSHLCTSGLGNVGVCGGDSGGPLMITKNNKNVLIGIASFGSALGCESRLPSVFTRVTSHIGFIYQHM